MTKKDYKLIASAFSERLSLAGKIQNKKSRETHYKELAQTLAEKLATENPRFDRQRFLSACGVTEQ